MSPLLSEKISWKLVTCDLIFCFANMASKTKNLPNSIPEMVGSMDSMDGFQRF